MNGNDADFDNELEERDLRSAEEQNAAEGVSNAVQFPADSGAAPSASEETSPLPMVVWNGKTNILMKCMVLAPLKNTIISVDGEISSVDGGVLRRTLEEDVLLSSWEGASGWNAEATSDKRSEQDKSTTFRFKFDHQDLRKIYSKDELGVMLSPGPVAPRRRAPPPPSGPPGSKSAAKSLSFDDSADGPAPKKPRAD